MTTYLIHILFVNNGTFNLFFLCYHQFDYDFVSLRDMLLEELARCDDPDRREAIANDLRDLDVPEEDINAAIEEGDLMMAAKQREKENAISSSSQPSVHHQSQYLPHGSGSHVVNTSQQGAAGFPQSQSQTATQSSQFHPSAVSSAQQAVVGTSQVATGHHMNTQVPHSQTPTQLQTHSGEVQPANQQSLQQMYPQSSQGQMPPQSNRQNSRFASPNSSHQNVPTQQQQHHQQQPRPVLPHSAPGPYSAASMKQTVQAGVVVSPGNIPQQQAAAACMFGRPRQQGVQRGELRPRMMGKVASQNPMLLQQLSPGQGKPPRPQNPQSFNNMVPNQVS